ncbi:MAG: hypothetical protein MRERV_1c128 [Mycoplasmataceae bacterium RV_VA103A]|nr:MAG: hypothetical protein MRERV_1c128 [Mycoplasmataceae bacterium RV_VA103A]
MPLKGRAGRLLIFRRAFNIFLSETELFFRNRADNNAIFSFYMF